MMMLTPALTKTQQKTEMSAEGKNLNLGLRVDHSKSKILKSIKYVMGKSIYECPIVLIF